MLMLAVRVATLLAVAAATGNSGPPAGNSPANNNNNLGFTLTIYEVDQSKLPPTLRLPELLAHTINLLNMDFDGRAVLRVRAIPRRVCSLNTRARPALHPARSSLTKQHRHSIRLI